MGACSSRPRRSAFQDSERVALLVGGERLCSRLQKHWSWSAGAGCRLMLEDKCRRNVSRSIRENGSRHELVFLFANSCFAASHVPFAFVPSRGPPGAARSLKDLVRSAQCQWRMNRTTWLCRTCNVHTMETVSRFLGNSIILTLKKTKMMRSSSTLIDPSSRYSR